MDIDSILTKEIEDATNAAISFKKDIGRRIAACKGALDRDTIGRIFEEARGCYALDLHKDALIKLQMRLRKATSEEDTMKAVSSADAAMHAADIQEKKQELREAVCKILREKLSLDSTTVIMPDEDVAEKFGVDSLDKIDIIMSIEDTFNMTIPDDEADRFKTINHIVAYIFWDRFNLQGEDRV